MTEQKFLLALDQYQKSGIHIGTKHRTTYMEPFVYKIRPDGLSVLNIQRIDERLNIAARLLSQYAPDKVIVVCWRENGWKPVRRFSETTGIRAFTGRYPPGILTNPKLDRFIEAEILLVVDPWPDKNAVNDAFAAGMPIMALCDTNNTANKIDLIVPCNNKGKKSLGLIFYIFAREYLKSRKVIAKESDFKYKIEDFTEEDEV